MHRDKNCTLCKLSKTAQFVCLMGDGDTRAEVMIVGEAPGQREDDSGVPFVGKAGQLLDRLLDEIGLDREDVYITNAVHCRPPNNRTPSKAEIKVCKKWLDYEIAKVNPKYIVPLGNVPLQAILGISGIKKARGKPVEHEGRIILPMYHPSFALRDPRQEPLLRYDFKKLREIIDFGGIPEERDLDFHIVDSESKVQAMLRDLRGCVSADLETTRLYPFTTITDDKIDRGIPLSKNEIDQHKGTHGGKVPRVVSIQFGTAKRQWVIPAETAGIWTREQLEDIVERITERLEDCYLVGHNWKFDALWMKVRFGVDWVADFDTMLAHYLLDENDLHGLKELAQKLLGAPDWDVGKDVKTEWSHKNAKYAAHDVYYTRKLKFHLAKKLFQDGDVQRVFRKIMMPCVRLFTEAEYDGIYIDQSKFDDADDYLRMEVANAEKELEIWAHPKWAEVNKTTQLPTINWGSAQQLGKLLFDDLKIKPLDKTKGGANSVSESVLLRLDHPMVGALLKWRAATKQLSAFIEGWRPYLDVNGYLHPSFKLHGTVTGRLSCEHPNLQQVPRDKRIRTLITAPDGWVLIEMDLSQIELRIAAELADEYNMLMAFKSGVDVHWLTAIREIERSGAYHDEVIETAYRHQQKKMSYSEAVEYILNLGPGPCEELMEMWKETRKKAKAINFGYLYGMWWKKFKLYARDNYGVIVSDEDAQSSRIAFFQLYPKFTKWHDRQRRFARMNGYVRSLSGRKRRLPDATSSHDTPQRREAERQAINSPVQSFANELNLMAALEMRDRFPRKVMRICGTVHDATLFRVRLEHVEEVYTTGLAVMAQPRLLTDFEIELKVPIEAEAKIGPWGAGLSLEKWLKQQREAARQ